MFVTTVATSLYLYFSILCQVWPLIARKIKSCDVLSRKQILSLDRIIRIKSPDHLFGLNFFDSVLYTIVFRASVLSFLIRVAEVPEKIIYYLLFCFSQILSCFVFPSFCKPWACFFFAKTFWQSWETVDLQEYPYFQQGTIILLWVLTSLIRLWWVMYEGSFQVCEGRW